MLTDYFGHLPEKKLGYHFALVGGIPSHRNQTEGTNGKHILKTGFEKMKERVLTDGVHPAPGTGI
jgi:hypothetical protein